MGKESVSEVMENHTKENIFKIKNTDMEFLRELMEDNMKECEKMEDSMEWGSIPQHLDKKDKGNGRMER